MFGSHAAPTLGGRAQALALGAIATLAMALALTPNAHAAWTNSFCNQTLGGGATCTMGQGYANHYSAISVSAWDRAGCVGATGYYGEMIVDWHCTPAGTQAFVYPPNPAGGWYRGTIRNNNSVNSGYFDGGAYCDPTYCV
jgi:hypothetical protein